LTGGRVKDLISVGGKRVRKIKQTQERKNDEKRG
jgi:hypothetical protein